ncbi:MAG: SDR family NAD(P)-dependent oxidoreductase [Candidatus Symbiobacter sp.]|nr:SDR family NAD(P)-dependent oxidoreductase [Candidatus Symbiobacter sp.]
MPNHIDLNHKVAIVTGGAQGIGRAICEKLAASGALVAVWDVDGELAAATAKAIPNARAFVMDQTDEKSVQTATEETLKHWQKIDILVNNAGIAGVTLPLIQYPAETWRQIIDINLNGVFYCCQAVVPHMIAQNYGRIVNIASIAGKEGNPNAAAYSASKAGVIALTKSLGKELASHDIAVNVITPAAAKTAILDQQGEAHVKFMLSKIPRGRFVTIEEIAAMVAWLVSQENSFTTGAVFDLSGGRATY